MCRMGHNDTTMALINLDELLEECLHRLWGSASPTLDATNTPSLDRTVFVVDGKLAATCGLASTLLIHA